MSTSNAAQGSALSRLEASFRKTVEGLSVDTPLIMHGSGDVDPSLVSPETVQLVSSLTAQYVSNLVDAAIDSHKILASDTGMHPDRVLDAPLPPFRNSVRSRAPPKPVSPELQQVAKRKRKRVRGSDDYWDQPLPEPKIKGSDQGVGGIKSIHVDEWVGLVGVDLREDRVRSSYVRGIEALSTSSFVFPVCHDVYAYGRVRAAQSAKRSIQPLLVQQPLIDMIQEDHNDSRTEKKSEKNDVSDPEDEENDDEKGSDDGGKKDDEDDEEAGPTWPGIDRILPLARIEDLVGSGHLGTLEW